MNPRFSILIPCYNRPEFIQQCIDSIFANTSSTIEVIVSDDNSSKWAEIESILTQYNCRDNFHVYWQENNLKWSDNRNFLLDKAKGDYAIMMGDDDLLASNALDCLESKIQADPSTDIIGFGYSIIDEFGKHIETRKALSPFSISKNDQELTKQLFVANFFPFWVFHPLTLCYSKNVYKHIKYDKRAFIGDDFMFLNDCLLNNRTINIIPDVLFTWRKFQNRSSKGEKNISFNSFNNIQSRINILEILESAEGLPQYLSDYVGTIDYREKFLYEMIALETSIDWNRLSKTSLSNQRIAEIKLFVANHSPNSLRIRTLQRRILEFYRLFGISSILESIRIGIERLKYRYSKIDS